MTRIRLACAAALLLPLSMAMPAPARAQSAATARTPFIVERMLWVKPNRLAQFNSLYQRVELTRLDALRKDGKLLWYRLAQPLLAARDDDWDLRVTMAWRDAEAAGDYARARLVKPGNTATERSLMDELIVDQQEVWVQETGVPGD